MLGSMRAVAAASASIRVIAALLVPVSYAQLPGLWRDPSAHKIQFVTVDRNVRLEVLDWGGSGRPIVLLSGLGGTAHALDQFAPKLTKTFHVYGVTRRGFGASSVPISRYDSDRLGDDVLAVLDSLKLYKPVLVGLSFGGAELSSVGSRRPDRVSGLVYLDAAYQYAFDDGTGSTLEDFQRVAPPQPPLPAAADLASFVAYQSWFERINGIAYPEAEFRQTMSSGPDGSVGEMRTPASVPAAALAGMKKYTSIPVPVLAIFAIPHDLGPWIRENGDLAVRAATDSFSVHETAWAEKQAKAFEKGVPSARVVRIPRANHAVFLSNEAEVLHEMTSFIATLK
jgi:non-heme chloroperoxidase